jgi:hypothetical protein
VVSACPTARLRERLRQLRWRILWHVAIASMRVWTIAVAASPSAGTPDTTSAQGDIERPTPVRFR